MREDFSQAGTRPEPYYLSYVDDIEVAAQQGACYLELGMADEAEDALTTAINLIKTRAHAERAGMDVSAYLVHAATRQMAESDAIEEQFGEVDALIARAERAAERLLTEPAPEPAAELTEQERREVEEALGLVQGRDRQGRRPGHAA